MQRVFVQLVGTAEKVVEKLVLAFDVTFEKRLGEFPLVGKVIEEPAFGDSDGRNQFLDGGRAEALLEHRCLRGVEKLFPRFGAFP